MSFFKDFKLEASDMINLKARVKNEMKRRNGYGDLTAYSAPEYDYINPPVSGKAVQIEHYSKIRGVMEKINPDTVGMSEKTVGSPIDAINILEANLTKYESRPRGERTNNDCAASCSGTCITTCTTSCTSCTGTCSGTCSGCSGGCTGCSGCGGACSSGCTSCSGTCKGGCSGCSGTCYGCTGCSSCTGSCSGGCWTSGCGTGCGGGCTSCTSCSGGCKGCRGGCEGTK